MKNIIIASIIIVVVLVAGYFLLKPTTEENTSPISSTEETAILEAVGEYEGDGTATRIFKDGVFTHTVSADVNEPSDGKFYEGWLVKKIGGVVTNFFSTGRMELSEDGSYVLTFTSEMNYEGYNHVVITEETEALGLDGNPEDHVLEGRF